MRSRVAKRMLTSVARLHGYAIFRRFLERSQWWSADQQHAWTRAALHRTLVGALAVPHYREAFRQIGFDPRVDFKDPSDLRALPILSKAQVRRDKARLVAPALARLSVVTHTSGSTGEPLGMSVGESFVAFDAACAFRHWSWAGYAWRQPMVALRSYVPDREDKPLWRYSRATNTLYMSAYHLSAETCARYIDQVAALRPSLIRGYPSSLTVFAEYAYPRRHQLASIRGVIASSETMLPNEREIIERTFGTRVFNWYGMTEPALILSECEHHEGLHVNWEYGHAELLPADDLPPDERRLVTTGFHNPVMPFIRYETGDIVRVFPNDSRCGCGRTMPLVHSVAGRKDECIMTPDGRRLPSLNFYTVFSKFPEVSRFQLVQASSHRVVARVAPRPHSTLGTDLLARLRDQLAARLGASIALDLEVATRFDTNADGKTLPIVRRAAV